MTWIDWLIVVGFFAALAVVAGYTQRYVRSVADFLAADRAAGRYLLTMPLSLTTTIPIVGATGHEQR